MNSVLNKIYSIYAYGRLSFSSGVVDYLAKSGIPIHFFNYYGFYYAREMKGLETHISGIESEIARLPGTNTIPLKSALGGIETNVLMKIATYILNAGK